MRSKHVFPLVLAAGLAWSTPARAANELGSPLIIALVALGLGSATSLAGTVTAVHNSVIGALDVPLKSGWRDAGYALAGVNLFGSAAWLTIGIATAADDHASPFPFIFSAGHGGAGALGLGMTLWADRTPEAPERRVMVVPAPMQDAGGRLTPGIAVTGVGF